MLSEKEIFAILESCHAIIQNSHLVYTSGKHGKAYVNKDAVYPRTDLISKLCREMALRFQDLQIDAVLAPALGGIILSQWVAHHLSEIHKKNVSAVYAEKDGDGFVIKRGYDNLIRGKNVLVVEDILTTGGSVKKVLETARRIPCNVVGVAALCNRGGLKVDEFGVPLKALVSVSLEAWDAAECPLCKEGVPINTSVGKGKSPHKAN